MPLQRVLAAALLLFVRVSGLRERRRSWHDGFVPVNRGAGKSAGGQLLVREDACVQGPGKYPQEATFATTEKSCLEGAMQVTSLTLQGGQANTYTDGAVLILMVHHMHSFSVYNIAHLAVSTFPVFDALRAKEEAGEPEDIAAVLFWQIGRTNGFLGLYDWFTKVPQLVGNRGLNTSLLFAEDLEAGVCAKRLLLYDRPILDGKVETHFFNSPAHARAFRERAILGLGLPGSLIPPARGRVALLAVRKPPQGYVNAEEITQKLGDYMKRRCWDLKVWQVGEGDMSLSNQVQLFANADLSISTYGAHLSNIVWQPPGSAVLIIHKCNMARRLFAREAREVGLQVFKSYPSDCRQSNTWGSNGQDVLDHGVHKADFQRDLLPVLERAMQTLGRADCNGAMPASKKG